MVAGGHDGLRETKSHAGSARTGAGKSVIAEEAEEPLLLRAGRRLPQITDASQRRDDRLHLRNVGAAYGAGATVSFEAPPVGRREISLQVGSDLVLQLTAGCISRGHQFLTSLRDSAEAPPGPPNAPGAAAPSGLSRESPECYTLHCSSALRRPAASARPSGWREAPRLPSRGVRVPRMRRAAHRGLAQDHM